MSMLVVQESAQGPEVLELLVPAERKETEVHSLTVGKHHL